MKRLWTTFFALLVGLALSFGSAQVDELTIWWAEWDPADFLQIVKIQRIGPPAPQPGGPAPGTEAGKQDFSAWESLRDDLEVALEVFEAARSRDVREQEIGDHLTVGPSEQLPEEYRRLVERYYRSLATQSERR